MSEKYSLNKEDGLKLLKGAGLAGGGAVVVYLLEVIGLIDFGPYTPMIVAIASLGLNAIRKYIQEQ